MTIQSLPSEVMYGIFQQMTVFETLTCRSVCKDWNMLAEESAKESCYKDFCLTTQIAFRRFENMTGQKITSFLPELYNKPDFSTLSSRQIHALLENRVVRGECSVEVQCQFSAADLLACDRLALIDIDLKLGQKFLHVAIKLHDLARREWIKKKLCCHFPLDLFEMNEGECTAFIFKKQAFILKAKQIGLASDESTLSELRFEQVLSSMDTNYGLDNDFDTFYIWQEDAYA